MVEFQAIGTEVVDAVGDHEVESVNGIYAIAELIPDTDEEVFDSPAAVRVRLQRSIVAAAMKRVVEAS